MAVKSSPTPASAFFPFRPGLFLLLLLLFAPVPAPAENPPSVPLTAGETARWREAGFSAASGGEWRYYGFQPGEARAWLAAGIEFPGWANQWKSEGFQPGEAGLWKDLTNVYTAAGFVKEGFSLAEAKVWLAGGVRSALRAREYRGGGIDAATGARFWALAIYPDDAGPWFRAGFSPEETLAWRYGPKDVAFYHTAASPHSRTVYRLESAVAWRAAGFAPEEAHRLSGFGVELAEAKSWLAAGFAADELLAWRDSGFSPATARRYLDAGLPPAPAEAAEFGASWAMLDEIPELAADLELLADGRLEVRLALTLLNRPGGAYADEFILPLPAETPLRYGQGHYRSATPTYRIKGVEVGGAAAEYRYDQGTLAIPLGPGEEAKSIGIAYTTDDRLLAFPHHDELSFTLIADNPGAVIRRARLAVLLPPGADVVFAEGEAGLPGRQDLLARVEELPTARRVVFTATRVLREKMSLRGNVAFTRGHVNPGPLRKFASLDHRLGRALTGLLVFVAGLLISSAYLLRVWHQYGRDPELPVSLQKSLSPGNLSPAEARLFATGGRVDGTSLLATLIHLAQLGALSLAENGGRFTLRREPAASAGLFPPEAAFLAELFAAGDSLTLSGRPAGRRLKLALRALRHPLRESFGNYYRSNLKYLFPGLAMSALAVAAGVYSLKIDEFGRLEGFRVFFAVALSLVALAQLAFFRYLLKAPTAAALQRRDALRGYRRHLETDLRLGKDPGGYLTPAQLNHLPFSLALGLDLGGMAIRRGQANWFHSRSGPFAVGDFAAALRTLSRRFKT